VPGIFLWECTQEGEINNFIQWTSSAEHRLHAEGRLRIATTSLESFQCPKQFFPQRDTFVCYFPTKTHILAATLHILLRSVVTVFSHYTFSQTWPECPTAVGMRNTLCTFNDSSLHSRVRGLLLIEVTANMLCLRNHRPIVCPHCWTSGIVQRKLKKPLILKI
jgi:hypothetical protein